MQRLTLAPTMLDEAFLLFAVLGIFVILFNTMSK